MTNSTETEIVLLQNGVKVSAYLKITAVYRESVSDDTDPDETLLELAHGNSIYIGRGKDYLYTDALADLQTKLSDDVFICCCTTCRFGNMCPFGNMPGMLSCTKDHSVRNKGDVVSLWDEGTEPPEVSSFGFCDSFAFQDEGHYTYNDYFYCLKRRKSADC